MGPPGRGKTHLAVALGREAIRQNYSVQFITAATLVATLAKVHADGALEKQLTTLGRPKLLIIDELGYLPFEPNAAHLFFQLVSRRYERGSILITSNRSVGEWAACLATPWSQPRSWTAFSIIRRSSPSAEIAIGSGKSDDPAFCRKQDRRLNIQPIAPTERGVSSSCRPGGQFLESFDKTD